MEIRLYCSFMLPRYRSSYQVHYDPEIEFSFNNIYVCESNAVQIFELIFCDSGGELLTYLFRKIILVVI